MCRELNLAHQAIYQQRKMSRVAVQHLLRCSINLSSAGSLTEWSQCFAEYVEELWITPNGIPCLRVVVNKAATEWWMGGNGSVARLEKWVEKAGFPLQLRGPWRLRERENRRLYVEGSPFKVLI